MYRISTEYEVFLCKIDPCTGNTGTPRAEVFQVSRARVYPAQKDRIWGRYPTCIPSNTTHQCV